MKKTLLVTIICVLTAAGAAFGQTITMSYNDNGLGGGTATSGTYSPTATFNFDVFFTTDFTSTGFSLWLETQTLNSFNTALSITGETYVNFTGPTDNGFPKSFMSTDGRSGAGFLTDTDTVTNPQTGTIDQGDLGATSPSHAPGTFQVLNIQFSLSGAAPGTYILESTTVSPRFSEATDANGFVDRGIATTQYTITIVPEPSTFVLLGLAATGFGLVAYRRRRALHS